MGLLDIFGPAPTTGLLSDPNAGLALVAGLLQGKRGEGLAPLGRGLLSSAQTYNQDQQQERANRASDLQQITGLYNIAKQRDLVQMVADNQAGRPHVTDPQLSVLEQKMAQLSGVSGLAGGSPTLSGINPTSAPPSQATPQAPASPAQLPAGVTSAQLAAGGFPQPGIGSTPAQPQAPNPMLALRNQADLMAAMSGHPEEIAQAMYKRTQPYVTKNGVYFEDPNNPGRMMLGGGMVPQGAMNVDFGPDGKPMISPLPGQIATAAATTGATTDAAHRASFPFSTVKLASGAEVPAFLAGIQPPPYNPATGQAGGPVPQAQPQGAPQVLPQPPQVSRPGVASLTVTQPSKNATQGDPYADIPKRAIPQGIGANVFDTKVQGNQADQATELQKELGSIAQANTTRIALNNQARSVVGNADTGWLANHVAGFRDMMAAWGVPGQDIKSANDAVLTKDLANAALSRGKQLFGARFTQGEVGIMLNQANPSPIMRETAIKFLLDTDNATAQYGINQANYLGGYLARGGDPGQFKAFYAQKYPVDNVLQPLEAQYIGSQKKQSAPLVSNMTATAAAKKAIAQGKDPQAVKQRMIDQGFDPSGI